MSETLFMCSCGSEGVTVDTVWGYVSLTSYLYSPGRHLSLWSRLKEAWQVLRRGGALPHDLVLTTVEAVSLADALKDAAERAAEEEQE